MLPSILMNCCIFSFAFDFSPAVYLIFMVKAVIAILSLWWISCRIYLILKEIRYLESDLIQYVWVKNGWVKHINILYMRALLFKLFIILTVLIYFDRCFGLVFHFLKWLMVFLFWLEQHLPTPGAKSSLYVFKISTTHWMFYIFFCLRNIQQ